MQKADLTTRAVAGFIDLLIIIGLARLPDVVGFLAAAGYLLVRDGMFRSQSVGKKLIGLRIASSDDPDRTVSYRESLLRNAPPALAFLLFFVPYAGWVLCPLVIAVEALTALGDDRGMRTGDLMARTWVVPADLPEAAAGETQNAPAQQPGDGSPQESGTPEQNP